MTQWRNKNTLCSSRKYPCSLHGRFLFCIPLPPGNSNLASNLPFKTSLSLRISDGFPWGGYGFFLELHIRKNLVQRGGGHQGRKRTREGRVHLMQGHPTPLPPPPPSSIGFRTSGCFSWQIFIGYSPTIHLNPVSWF